MDSCFTYQTFYRDVPPAAGEYWNKIVVYTDGASSRNGTIHAKAGIGVYFGPNDKRNLSEPLPGACQTSERAELYAIMRAIAKAGEAGVAGGGGKAVNSRAINICTDSLYSIKCMTLWYYKWQRNGWRTTGGQPVQNKDLILKGRSLIKKLQGAVEFTHVRGHQGIEGNEQADRLAILGAQQHYFGDFQKENFSCAVFSMQ
ncbi:ribonuclease H-like domain-containing protein [Kickxella alabastrina]|uniref:ribonuclease H-like domain-containing protein n=1 Tax=Kickxella alabastrina TaxID=61397 RepID=UPI00221F8928|nr:ribonuclease H-like domain-containing protein [Kickxella alabastrina]KAI7825069.1 ribonuclease H-like domain-containing protein [Kickxella alabastrina]